MKVSLFTTPEGKSYGFTFGLVCSLFLLWALCNGMIDVMDKHFQDFLHLTKAQSAWVQFAHYTGYAFMALPAGWLARKFGYKFGILTGLVTVAAGCLWFVPATSLSTFWAFLLGICVISMGLTFLETVANPYTTVLGAPQYSAVRINIAQSFNGIGWILGPILGGMFFYSDKGAEVAHQQLWIPYAGIATGVLVLAVIFFFSPIPDIENEDDYHLDDSTPVSSKSIWAHGHFTGAVIAQFLYVAAQAGIFSFFINYIVEELPPVAESLTTLWVMGGQKGFELRETLWFISEQGATKLLSLGFIMFLLGRFTGSGLLTRLAAHKAIGLYASASALMMLLIMAQLGWVSVIALFLAFFFMSIMFPTIFALGIHGLGKKSKVAASFIVMAIVGGALLPKLMGYLGDTFNMSIAFAMPLVCFLGIATYGFLWSRLSGSPGIVGISPSRGH